jgi:DNA-directed RNA polymerase specialized sigma subunit
MERKNRSQSYQQLFNEIAYASEVLEAFPNEDGMAKRLNPFAYDDRISDLEDELKKEFWRVVDTMLTPRQRAVIKLYTDGYTQMEIAKALNVNQSSITKSLNGNICYDSGRIAYGGSKKRLKKIIENDDKIKEILRKIAELRDESWI